MSSTTSIGPSGLSDDAGADDGPPALMKRIDKLYPRLLPALRDHPHIAFVLGGMDGSQTRRFVMSVLAVEAGPQRRETG